MINKLGNIFKNGVASIGLHLMPLGFLYPSPVALNGAGSHDSHFPTTQEFWCDGDIAKVPARYLPFPHCPMKACWA